MDWKELLKNFRLFDFQIKAKDIIKGQNQQVGLINKVQIYNLNVPQDTLEKIIEVKITEALEATVKDKALKKLEPLSHELDLLSESSAISVVASTMATTTVEVTTVECMKLTDEAIATVHRPTVNIKK